MILPTPFEDSDSYDLSQIFIGRKQELIQFQRYLEQWKKIMKTASPTAKGSVAAAPSPNHKIEGLVVLLYGDGGFGKSTLLKHYHKIASEPGWNFTVGKIVDWEFAIGNQRSIFDLAQGQELDEVETSEYFRLLSNQLAEALGKRIDQFKEFREAIKAVEEAKKQASTAVGSLQKDDRFAELPKLTAEALVMLVCLVDPTPITKVVLENEKVIEVIGKGVEFTAKQLAQVYTKLHDTLGQRLNDYLEPSLKLGVSLGRDLARLAKDFPLLIFFDTYEEIGKADNLLKLVIGAAGTRVGWVLAGRANLWAGPEQRGPSLDMVYGYKEIVPSDRGLAIGFKPGSTGAFTVSDIVEYFAQLREQVRYKPLLPSVTEEGALRILEVTQGVPLAVKIAAGLYLETADLESITEKAESKRKVVDKMVRRYLLHTHANLGDRARLYGLALLRRADNPASIAAALELSSEQAKTSYEAELSRLHRRYSFIFTEKAQPSLHQEVRHFLRLWLLEHRSDPEIEDVNERLRDAHESTLKKLEARLHHSSLKEWIGDEEWVETYLDLTEQQFWLDPAEGVRYSLPIMIAAALYCRDVNREVAAVGKFFETNMKQPFGNWWKWAIQRLVDITPSYLSFPRRTLYMRMGWAAQRHMVRLVPNAPTGLEEMAEELVSQIFPNFPMPFSECRAELEAIVWWCIGEAYLGEDNQKALQWYEKALTRLNQQVEVREAAAEVCWNVALKLHGEKYSERLPLLNRAIELKPDYSLAYYSRGNVYNDLEEYPRAIDDYNQAIALEPRFAPAYYGRGNVYSDLKEYQRAIADYGQAIALDSEFPLPYYGRGTVYSNLKEYRRAIADYDRAIELDAKFAIAYYNRGLAYLWLKNTQQARGDFSRSWELNRRNLITPLLAEWSGMGTERVGTEMVERLEGIAAIDPGHYGAQVCRGVASGLCGKLKEGLTEIEQAITLKPGRWHAYFWKGMICAYLGRNLVAKETIEKALEMGLPPVLLKPLYWLERDRTDFYREYAMPLLARYEV